MSGARATGQERSQGPGGGKPKRGAAARKGKNRPQRSPRTAEQNLEAQAQSRGSRATGERGGDEVQGGSGRRRAGTAAGRDQTPVRKPWTWLRDETSP